MFEMVWDLVRERKTTLFRMMFIFISVVVWVFGYIFSRGRIPTDHPDGNNEDLVIPLWHKEPEELSAWPEEKDD